MRFLGTAVHKLLRNLELISQTKKGYGVTFNCKNKDTWQFAKYAIEVANVERVLKMNLD